MKKTKKEQSHDPVIELPKVWWYEQYISRLCREIDEFIRLRKWAESKPKDEDEAKSQEVLIKTRRNLIGLNYWKIEMGCIDLNNFRGMISLEGRLKSYSSFDALSWAKQAALEFFENDPDIQWHGFDQEVFDRNLESKMTPAAIKFRQDRGHDFLWREPEVK